MKTKQFETILYSAIGIVAMLLLLVAVNFIAGRAKQRVDLTAEKAYTLSPGTRAILAKLDTPVQIRFYCTQEREGDAGRSDDLRPARRRSARANIGRRRTARIEIQRLDPEPDSDAEDSARLDGVEPQQLSQWRAGLSRSEREPCSIRRQAIPFSAPDRERLLEYDISRAIARVMTPEKPTIGVMSPLPVMGQMNPMMPMQQRENGRIPGRSSSELKRDFNVKQVELTATEIPDDIKVLVVIHPKGNFGGDPVCARPVCSARRQAGRLCRPALRARPGRLEAADAAAEQIDARQIIQSLGRDFRRPRKVVADLEYVARIREGPNPAVLALNETAINKDDVLTANADNLVMVFSGAFAGTPAAGLTETVLLHSSKAFATGRAR